MLPGGSGGQSCHPQEQVLRMEGGHRQVHEGLVVPLAHSVLFGFNLGF